MLNAIFLGSCLMCSHQVKLLSMYTTKILSLVIILRVSLL